MPIKIAMGFGLFIVLCLVIWFPLLFFIQGNPGNQANFVTQVEVRLGIEGYEEFYKTAQSVLNSSVDWSVFTQWSKVVPTLGNDDKSGTQLILLQEFSQTTWDITPPARQALLSTLLENSTQVNFLYSLNFRRSQPPTMQDISIVDTTLLNNDQKYNLASVMIGTNSTAGITSLMPRFYRLPISAPISTANQLEVSITLSLLQETESIEVVLPNGTVTNYSRFIEYWQIEQQNDNLLFNESGIQIVTISSLVPLFAVSFASTGIIGLYTVFVLAIGRLLRSGVSGLSHIVIYEDMPEVDELIHYCEDIFLAREDGELELEEELFRELIELYRSPERMILRTLPKAPRFKLKTKQD